jgi:hypothetical protein
MCQQAYGTPKLGPGAKPTNAQSYTLMFWKKAISFFMPWNAISGQGNLTRSIGEVNKMIKKV